MLSEGGKSWTILGIKHKVPIFKNNYPIYQRDLVLKLIKTENFFIKQ